MDEPQKVSALEADDRTRLEGQRASVRACVAPESLASLETAAGKLGLIRGLLAAGMFRADEAAALQALGVVLGDALVQHLDGAEWVMVEDEYGRDPAVRIQGTSILVFPLTMVSKRLEAGQPVDVFAMFNGVLDHVEDLRGRASDVRST